MLACLLEVMSLFLSLSDSFFSSLLIPKAQSFFSMYDTVLNSEMWHERRWILQKTSFTQSIRIHLTNPVCTIRTAIIFYRGTLEQVHTLLCTHIQSPTHIHDVSFIVVQNKSSQSEKHYCHREGRPLSDRGELPTAYKLVHSWMGFNSLGDEAEMDSASEIRNGN